MGVKKDINIYLHVYLGQGGEYTIRILYLILAFDKQKMNKVFKGQLNK